MQLRFRMSYNRPNNNGFGMGIPDGIGILAQPDIHSAAIIIITISIKILDLFFNFEISPLDLYYTA